MLFRSVQVYRKGDGGEIAARAFRRVLPVAQDRPIDKPGEVTTADWKTLAGTSKPSALVLWLSEKDLTNVKSATIATRPPMYFSPTLTASTSISGLSDRTYLTWPYRLPATPAPQENRVRSWLLGRSVTSKTYERLQFNTWYTMSLLDYSMDCLVEDFSQEYLIETVEREAESSSNPGVYQRLSLGPGQHFASKGAYIVKPTGRAGGVAAMSPWIVP